MSLFTKFCDELEERLMCRVKDPARWQCYTVSYGDSKEIDEQIENEVIDEALDRLFGDIE